MSYCLAKDIGASSGRHILGEYVKGEIATEEIYRFDNGKNIGGMLMRISNCVSVLKYS